MSNSLRKLLGKELSRLSSEEKLTTLDVEGKCQIIGLFFMKDEAIRHGKWCEKTRNLCASLIKLHKEVNAKKDGSFEVVLVSMDELLRSEESKIEVKKLFLESDSPLVISSEKASKIQEYLTRKFEIQESPSLVLLDVGKMEVIIYDGEEKLLQDPKGAQFPWSYPPYSDILESARLIQNLSLKMEASSSDETKALETKPVPSEHWRSTTKGLLFAAFWCPPCRSFIAALHELYDRLNKDGKKFEIVFVSSDRSEESFKRFYSTMPWLAVPYEDEKLRNTLMKAFNVKAIPNLTILDENDEVITRDGRLEVNDDIEGIEFPWYPRPVDELRDRHTSTVNNSLCVIYFTDDSEADYEKAELVFNLIASEVTSSDLEEALEPKFFIAADSDLAESLRIFMDLDESKSYLVITDVVNFRYAVRDTNSDENLTESFVNDFINEFQTNQLVYKYIQARFI